MKITVFIILCSLLVNGCSFVIPVIIPFKDLPPPSGEYSVGTRIFNWVDSEREEWFTSQPDDHRKLVVQIWYPAVPLNQDKIAYVDYPKERNKPMAEQIGIPGFLISHLGDVQANSVIDADPSTFENPLPLIIFSHGLGGMRTQNSIQMEELASQGYVTLAIDHSYDSNITFFSDGSFADFRAKMRSEVSPEEFWSVRLPQLNTRVADLTFVLNHLEQLQSTNDSFWEIIDLTQVGVMGHSFGGGTAIVSSVQDTRFDACLALDGWLEPVETNILEKGLSIPFLYIGRPEWDNPINYANLDKLIANSIAPAEKLLLEGTKHFDYADIPHFTPVAGKIGVAGKMPSSELLDTLNTRIVSFFQRYLQHNQLAN